MSGHDVMQMLAFIAIGVWSITFGRRTYRNPKAMHDRWLRGSLPRRKWFLRGMAAIWIFIGFLAIGSALVYLPPLNEYRGESLVLTGTLIALVATIIVLSTTPREDSRCSRQQW
jgi:hypothetical protein